ncbi:MAG TPA: HD domain-containing protein [Kofleriaceae bacterium]|nr:HD domain-containing protein [Kofleriaceae bacterium]
MFSVERYTSALWFAAERHDAQRFPGKEMPYLVHVVTVAAEVIAALPTSGLDGDLAVPCALLHDTVEDTKTTPDEIAARFGGAVADGVRALSKNPTLAKADQMADCLRRIREQPREVWAVKLADRISNLDEPPAYWPRDKRIAYRAEAQTILDALGAASATLAARLAARIESYAAYCG